MLKLYSVGLVKRMQKVRVLPLQGATRATDMQRTSSLHATGSRCHALSRGR